MKTHFLSFAMVACIPLLSQAAFPPCAYLLKISKPHIINCKDGYVYTGYIHNEYIIISEENGLIKGRKLKNTATVTDASDLSKQEAMTYARAIKYQSEVEKKLQPKINQ